MGRGKPGPHFLGIGAQRCGTTWLWSALQAHPDAWLPPLKELHYFDRAKAYPTPSYLAEPKLEIRLRSGSHECVRYRNLLSKTMRETIKANDAEAALWYARFFFQNYSDAWYLSLFDTGDDRLTGEITPSYAILDENDVSRVRELLPDVKIIYILRDPVERSWSNIRLNKDLRGTDTELDQLDNVRRLVAQPGHEQRSNFLETLDKWTGAYPEDQFFLGFYDDIIADPGGFYADICRFLELTPPSQSLLDGIQGAVNAATPMVMPPAVREFLSHAHMDQLRGLSERLGGHATTWLQNAERFIETSSLLHE